VGNWVWGYRSRGPVDTLSIRFIIAKETGIDRKRWTRVRVGGSKRKDTTAMYKIGNYSTDTMYKENKK
jgi:hypothetical protein